MENLIVSFDSNILKISYYDKKNSLSSQAELPNSVVNDSNILDPKAFAQILNNSILNLNTKVRNPVLNFLISPEHLYTFFMSFGKSSINIEQSIIIEAKKRLNDVSIDDLYFSYQKIAPFVYQFIGIKKTTLENLLEVSNASNIPLQSVVPWLFLFPRLIPDNDTCIFITKSNNKHVVALSEYNGIYYNGTFDDVSTEHNALENLVNDLSVYKRVNPIKRVFLLDYEGFDATDKFSVSELPLPINGLTQSQEHKTHILFNFLFDKDPTFLETNLNLLNLLQLPAIQNSNTKLAKVGVMAVLVLLLGGFGFFALNNFSQNTGTVAGDSSNILTAQPESTTTVSDQEVIKSDQNSQKDEITEPNKKDDSKELPQIDKADLKIRVENGAGIPGIAAKTQKTLEELGYTVVGIGNSDDANRENTLIKFKSSKTDFKVLLTEDVKKDFELVVEDDLDESLEYDVLFVIGAN